MNTTDRRGLATWVFVLLLAATAGGTFLILMLYQNIVASAWRATKDVFRHAQSGERRH